MAPAKFNSLYNEAKDYTMILVGLAFYAIGFTAFILPHHVVIGGMSGVGTLVFFATNQTIPVAVTMYTVNVMLLLCGAKVLGKAFVIRTTFGATGASLMIGALEGYFISHPPLIADISMSVILGGIFCGIGIGTIYIHNGTSGGTDIVAALVSKVSNVSVGRTLMIVDMTIVGLSIFLPFEGTVEQRIQHSVPLIIYGWVVTFIYSYITDQLINTNRQATQFVIFSSKWKEIADKINSEAHRGVTVMDGQGWYSKHDIKILMVWCRKIEKVTIFRIIKTVDPDAFISQAAVNGVYGNGFDKMKIKQKKNVKGSHPDEIQKRKKDAKPAEIQAS